MQRTILLLIFAVISFVSQFMLSEPASSTENSKDQALLNKADSLLQADHLETAKEVYQKIFNADENSIPALTGLGRIALQQRKWGKARNYFNKILDLEPENLDAWYYQGICYREERAFWSRSEKYFQKVLSRDSLFQDVLYQYALIYKQPAQNTAYRIVYFFVLKFGTIYRHVHFFVL